MEVSVGPDTLDARKRRKERNLGRDDAARVARMVGERGISGPDVLR